MINWSVRTSGFTVHVRARGQVIARSREREISRVTNSHACMPRRLAGPGAPAPKVGPAGPRACS